VTEKSKSLIASQNITNIFEAFRRQKTVCKTNNTGIVALMNEAAATVYAEGLFHFCELL